LHYDCLLLVFYVSVQLLNWISSEGGHDLDHIDCSSEMRILGVFLSSVFLIKE
jgi:hypothetical protein